MRNVHQCFTIPIFENKLELDVSYLEEWAINLSRSTPARQRSNWGGYQSPDIIKETALDPLINIIEEDLEHQVVDNIWINVNGHLHWNRAHIHPYAAFSGVFYVKTPEECGTIEFQHPAYDLLSYVNPILPKDKRWPTGFSLPAIENMLYLFPAYLKHSVSPNMNEKEKRISISFNTITDTIKSKWESSRGIKPEPHPYVWNHES